MHLKAVQVPFLSLPGRVENNVFAPFWKGKVPLLRDSRNKTLGPLLGSIS